MKKQIIPLACFFLIKTLSCFAEDSALVGAGVLRVTASPVYYGFQIQDWGGWVTDNGASTLGAGLGLEYGVNSWLNAYAFCLPGFSYLTNLSKADTGELDQLADLYLGFKAAVINGGGPVAVDRQNLSVGLGVYAPVYVPEGKIPTAMHLWGIEGKVWYDYVCVPGLFTLNGALGLTYYPVQQTSSMLFDSSAPEDFIRRAEQPLEIDFELEGRFQYIVGGQYGVELYWGLPLGFTVIPLTNMAGGGMPWSFSTGLYFTVALTETIKVPMDFTVKYEAPLVGKNLLPLQRITLLARFNIDFPQLTAKPEPSYP